MLALQRSLSKISVRCSASGSGLGRKKARIRICVAPLHDEYNPEHCEGCIFVPVLTPCPRHRSLRCSCGDRSRSANCSACCRIVTDGLLSRDPCEQRCKVCGNFPETTL